MCGLRNDSPRLISLRLVHLFPTKRTRKGLAPLKRAGTPVIVQDEATSVVWGMPGPAIAAGLADQVLPLESFADAVAKASRSMVRRSRIFRSAFGVRRHRLSAQLTPKLPWAALIRTSNVER